MVFADVVGASGIAAACVWLLIMEAPTSATAEPVRKFRRESIVLSFQLIAASPACIGDDCATEPAQATAPEHGNAEIGVGKPEIALGFYVCHFRCGVLSRRFEQRENIDLHGIILQFRLLGDRLA